MSETDPNQLVTVTCATSEFTAHILVAILEEAGVDARTFGSTGTTLGISGLSQSPRWGVPVQVRRGDLEQARAALQANRRDSIDIDWDMVDVGTSGATSAGPHHPPVLPRVGWVIAAALVLVGLLAALAILIQSF